MRVCLGARVKVPQVCVCASLRARVKDTRACVCGHRVRVRGCVGASRIACARLWRGLGRASSVPEDVPKGA